MLALTFAELRSQLASGGSSSGIKNLQGGTICGIVSCEYYRPGLSNRIASDDVFRYLQLRLAKPEFKKPRTNS